MQAVSNITEGRLEPSTRFGPYLVERDLGSGGMARVFQARHVELGSLVALKVLNPGLSAEPQAASRFIREAKTASRLRHEHIVRVFDLGTENGVPFIVMELLDGEDLAALLEKKGPLPLAGIAEIFLPVLSAVAAAHAAGVIHRDLKPANVILARRPPHALHPVVVDFGISKLEKPGEENLTRSESLLGTVQYMAPELTRGARFASPESDQYALGVMLYECATGRRPFSGEGHYEIMHAIVTAPVTPPHELNPSLPAEFSALVLRAMARDPKQRFKSVPALAGALLSFGDRTAWTLWANELVSGVRQEPWLNASGTWSDGVARATPEPLASSKQRTARLRWMLAGIGGCATVLVILSAARSATIAKVSPVATESRTAHPPPALPPSPSVTQFELPPPAPLASPTPELVAAPLASTPGADRHRVRARGVELAHDDQKPDSNSVAAPAASAATPSPSASAGSAIVVGRNGAPIVD